MYKLAGAVMIIAAGGLIGVQKSAVLKYRCDNLQKLISALTLLENEISYGKTDIMNALYSIGKIQDFPLFANAAENMRTLAASDAFLKAASDKNLYYSESDLEILRPLAENLGMTGSTSQIKTLSHTVKLLESVLAEAREKYEQNGRLYKNIGLLGGIFTAILLF